MKSGPARCLCLFDPGYTGGGAGYFALDPEAALLTKRVKPRGQ